MLPLSESGITCGCVETCLEEDFFAFDDGFPFDKAAFITSESVLSVTNDATCDYQCLVTILITSLIALTFSMGGCA